MSKGRTSKARLGLFLSLALGLFAFVVAPAPALAADSGTSQQSVFNVGGLEFQTENPNGPTVTSVNLNDSTVVVTGGDANFTVVQRTLASGTMADSIQIGDDGAPTDAYTGTITLNGVELSPANSAGITLSGSRAGCAIQFNNPAPKKDEGATLVLASGTTITGGAATPTISMGGSATYKTNDTLVVQSGAKVINNASGSAVSVADNITGTTSNEVGDATIEMAGGTLQGGGATNGALAFNATTGGTLSLDVTGNSTIEGTAGADTGAAGNVAMSIASAANSDTAPAGVTISGPGVLSVLGGNGTIYQTTGYKGGSGIYLTQGYLAFDGDGNTIVQGGRGGDDNTSSDNVGTPGTSCQGGTGIDVASAAAAAIDVNAGSLSVQGGTGGAAYIEGNIGGGNGGPGISLGGTSTSSNAKLNLNGGDTLVLGGTGGNGGQKAGDLGTQGEGGSAIVGATTDDYSILTVAYDPDVANDYPTLTAQGGMGKGTPSNGTDPTQAISDFNTTPGTSDIIIANGSDTDGDFYPWVAYTTMTGLAPTSEPNEGGTLQGFAGMQGSSATGAPAGVTSPSPLGPAATQYAKVTQVNLAAAGANYVCIEPAEITGLNAGVVNYNDQTAPVDYVMAQTEATMIGNKPTLEFLYMPALDATFENLENVSTSNFGTLAGVGALSYTNTATTNDATITPAENVSAYEAPATNNTFFVVDDAQGNDLTVTLDKDVLDEAALDYIMDIYPNLTLSSSKLPVVYTIDVNAGQGLDATTPLTPTSGIVYTNPDGSGNLVTATESTPATLSNVKPLNVIASETATSTDYVVGVQVKPAANNQFIGLFDETGGSPTQVSVNNLSGWDSNAILVAEGGKVTLGNVTPSPTTVAQGKDVEVSASYTIAPVNDKITSYSLNESGLTANWKAVFVNLGTGNAGANGVTVTQTGGSTATTAPFTVTSVATVSANETADLGNYRVWPSWMNTVDSNGLPTTNTKYGIVEVVAGSGQPSGTSINVVRMYNPNSLEHLYTTDVNEVETLEDLGWDNEDVAWVAPTTSAVPIYRLYNQYNGDHMYTVSENEYETLQEAGWTGEGPKLYSAPTTGVPVYRLYNPYMTANEGAFSHLWTGDFNEYNTLGTYGWNKEGVAWHALSVPAPV